LTYEIAKDSLKYKRGILHDRNEVLEPKMAGRELFVKVEPSGPKVFLDYVKFMGIKGLGAKILDAENYKKQTLKEVPQTWVPEP
jgi:hypothetical protein